MAFENLAPVLAYAQPAAASATWCACMHTSLGLEAWPEEAESDLAAIALRLTEADRDEVRRRVLGAHDEHPERSDPLDGPG